MRSALTTSRTLGNWSRRSSGILTRVALYSAYCSWRNVGPGQVERHGQVVGLEVRDAAQDDAGEAEHAVDELALRRREGRQGEVSAVDEPVAVEQHQAFGGHVPSVAGDRARTELRGARRRPGSVAEAVRRPAQAEQRQPEEEHDAGQGDEARQTGLGPRVQQPVGLGRADVSVRPAPPPRRPRQPA